MLKKFNNITHYTSNNDHKITKIPIHPNRSTYNPQSIKYNTLIINVIHMIKSKLHISSLKKKGCLNPPNGTI